LLYFKEIISKTDHRRIQFPVHFNTLNNSEHNNIPLYTLWESLWHNISTCFEVLWSNNFSDY